MALRIRPCRARRCSGGSRSYATSCISAWAKVYSVSPPAARSWRNSAVCSRASRPATTCEGSSASAAASENGMSRPTADSVRSCWRSSSGRRSIRDTSSSWIVAGTGIPGEKPPCSRTARASSSRKSGLPSARANTESISESAATASPRIERTRARLSAGASGGNAARGDAEDAQEIVGAALGRPARPVEAALDLFLDDVGRVRFLHPRHRTGQLDHRAIGHGIAVGDAVGLDAGRRLRRDHTAELVQQPRLADAGGARDAHRLGVAARGRLEAAAQQVQLLLVVHERDDAPAEAEPRADVAAEHEVPARLVHLPEIEAPLEE